MMLARWLTMMAVLSYAAAPTGSATGRGNISKEEAARRDKLVQDSKKSADYWKGYKPKFKGQKVLLRLIPRDKVLRPGQEFWYRVELANVGSKPVEWSGYEGAFFKTGEQQGNVRFFIIDAAGRREELRGPEHLGGSSLVPEVTLPADWSREQRTAYLTNITDPRRSKLSVELKPGETLVSRGGPDPSDEEFLALIEAGKDPDTAQRGAYRKLNTRYAFERPGRYRIQVTIDNPAPPPGDWSESYPKIREKWVLGVTKSNLAQIEPMINGALLWIALATVPTAATRPNGRD